ncbi:hypothetical protein R8Z50_27865 [Longispora sp. K20-0274]|uniref:hypothetical protein n=1 Tax=Longispora sp. K20-0274 TaxID=3088255 RepID=UPI00399BFBFC
MIDRDENIGVPLLAITVDQAQRRTSKRHSRKRGNWLAQAELNVSHGSRHLLSDNRTLSSPEYPPPFGEEIVTSTGELARLGGSCPWR